MPIALLAVFLASPGTGEVSDALARGDAAYARRAEGNDGSFAQLEPISSAVVAYEEALAMDPSNLTARTKLLRALFYLGEYATRDPARRLPIFEHGQELAEEGIDQLIGGTDLERRGGKHFGRLVSFLRDDPNSVGIYYWAAVHWGLWGRHRGKIAAAKQGVAGKIRDYGAVVVSLDPGYEAGGGHRMLGRLHTEAPKLPFITGWISRKTAIAELEKARAYSDDALTALYFIEALLEFAPARKTEAMRLLRALVQKSPDPAYSVEESRAIAEAQELLLRLTD